MNEILNAIGPALFAFVIGAIVGSFLNVVIHRGPTLWRLIDSPDGGRGDLVRPRSYCPHCRTPIRFWRLIPIVSYIILRGRCADCGAKIPIRYLLVEIAAAAHAVLAIAVFGPGLAAIFAGLFGWIVLALAVIDLETGYLPDWLTGALALAGLAANANSTFVTLIDALVGGAIGVFAFWAIGALWRRFRNVDALGLGDAKLLGALGAWMGWEALPLVVLTGSLASLAGVAISNIRGSKIGALDAVPFGPGLALGGYLVFMTPPLAA